MTALKIKNKIFVKKPEYFDLSETLECGQYFRFDKISEGKYKVASKDKFVCLEQKDGDLIFYDISEENLEEWLDFFDFGTDYCEIMNNLFLKDEKFKDIAQSSKGIRILKQDSWEALCSFIISQNNNIPRIKKIISKFCELFGEPADKDSEFKSFPKVDKVARLSVEDLSEIKSGFRARYIIDAAKKVCYGDVDMEKVRKAEINQAMNELTKIVGVGKKVAMCTLLYGFHRLEAFPVDVWINRAMNLLYPDKDYTIFGCYAGVAQQYIFNYIRNKM